ncbi:MAG: DUF1987 domain-containing protein [bacterium]
MNELLIHKTKNTLEVNFKANGNLELSGSSFPENATEFFTPTINWIKQYMLEITGKIVFNLKFDYVNSSSIKYISDIIDKLQNYHTGGGEVEINWYYDENDEDIQEMGEDLKEDVDFTFNLIMK